MNNLLEAAVPSCVSVIASAACSMVPKAASVALQCFLMLGDWSSALGTVIHDSFWEFSIFGFDRLSKFLMSEWQTYGLGWL